MPPAAVLQSRVEPPADLPEQVSRALREDIGSGDVTAQLIGAAAGAARVLCREGAVCAARPGSMRPSARSTRRVRIDWRVADGQRVRSRFDPVRTHRAGARDADRRAHRAEFPAAAVGHRDRHRALCPGARRHDVPHPRYAQDHSRACAARRNTPCAAAAAHNHRMGLYDMVLDQGEPHRGRRLDRRRRVAARALSPAVPVEVESKISTQLAARHSPPQADWSCSMNFDARGLARAVALNRAAPRPALLEASGGVTLERIGAIAATGVDYISRSAA
jgi:nicotinate-nucleotide pyrophosphorylase (carboxylating)